jgi:hypothetical protein
MSGRRSNLPFQTLRASSYPTSPDTSTLPSIASRNARTAERWDVDLVVTMSPPFLCVSSALKIL